MEKMEEIITVLGMNIGRYNDNLMAAEIVKIAMGLSKDDGKDEYKEIAHNIDIAVKLINDAKSKIRFIK